MTEREKFLNLLSAMVRAENSKAEFYFKDKAFEAASFHYARATALLQCQLLVDKEAK